VPETKTTRNDEGTAHPAGLRMAFELGLKTWKLGFARDFSHRPLERRIAGGDTKALMREIEGAKRELGLPPDAPVVSCYEAGRDGFWLHRFLIAQGIENLVVDPASLEVSRRARRAKSDRIDLRKLLTRLLRHLAGEPKVWSVVRVPSAEAEDARSLHRELRTLVKERTRSTNRIKGLLMNQGVRLEAIRGDFRTWLGTVRVWDGTALPAGVRSRIEREYARRQVVHEQIRALEAERRRALRGDRGRAQDQARQLATLRGIGAGGAWLLSREFFAWRAFRSGKEVGGLSGLAPSPFQSGEQDHEQGISRAGNRHVRSIAVELAWGWLRHQPESALTRWYQRRFAHGGPRARKVGIVAVARKLLIALWRFLETGAVPEGALLKAA
jgi:transposase